LCARSAPAPPAPDRRSMPDLGPSFRQFATGLKQRAER
jgi:hypothetical protein